MRHILLIAFAYPPENIVGALRPARFARYLAEHSYRAHVITASPQTAPSPEVRVAPDLLKTRPGVFGKALRLAEAALLRLLYHNDQHLSWTLPAVFSAERLLRRQPVSAILSTSPPHATHLTALYLKRKYRLPWIADFRDPILGNAAADASQPESRFDVWLERRIFAEADAVIANTDAAGDTFRARYPQHASKIHVIPNGYDPAEPIGPLPIPPRKQKILAHVGGIYGGRHPGAVLGAVERLTRSGAIDPAGFRVDLFGLIDRQTVPDFQLYDELAARGCLYASDAVIPRSDALRITCEADYLLLLDWKGLQVPFKLYEYIRVGRPVFAITVPGAPACRILADSGIPHVTAFAGDPPDVYDRRLLELLSLPSTPVRASEWFREAFDCSAQTARLAVLLDSVTAR